MTDQAPRIRNRARRRQIATKPILPIEYEIELFEFKEGIAEQFTLTLGTRGEANTAAGQELTSLANTYRGWKSRPASSREIIRSQLQEMANIDTVEQ